MLAAGMFPYALGKGGATVPPTIYWRVLAIGAVFILMFALPDIPNIGPAGIRGLAGPEDAKGEELADDAGVVRKLIWWYCLTDLVLLTYLVHITGGITGSMFAGLYLLVPSLALLGMLGSEDVARAFWLIFWAAVGIAASFFFSHFHEIEYDASQYPHAFDISLTLVSLVGISLLIVQVLVVKRQLEVIDREAKARSEESARDDRTK